MAISWPHVTGGARGEQDEREQRQRERRRVEDVHAPPSRSQRTKALPETHGDEQKLQAEPVVLEPQEQVRAEDDRERPEAEQIGLAARPGQQHVERVREEQLRRRAAGEVVDRRPVPAPVRVNGGGTRSGRSAGPGRRDQAAGDPPADGQHRLPDEQHRRGPRTTRSATLPWTRGNSASPAARGERQKDASGRPLGRRRLRPGLGGARLVPVVEGLADRALGTTGNGPRQTAGARHGRLTGTIPRSILAASVVYPPAAQMPMTSITRWMPPHGSSRWSW